MQIFIDTRSGKICANGEIQKKNDGLRRRSCEQNVPSSIPWLSIGVGKPVP